MNLHYPKLTQTIFAAIAAALFFLSASSVWAQGAGSPPPLMTERERTLDVERDKRTRGPEITPSPRYSRFPVNTRALRMANANEIKKDAERIQFFNTEMMRAVSVSAPLDYDRIIKTTGEIKKHARRLMSNLKLPWIKKAAVLPKGQDELNDKELVASLTRLNELVKSLSANPLLVNRNVVDVRQSSDAGRDLEGIIVLSEKIRKSAKQLRHAARQ
jgi:hypothetical protein